MCEKRVDEGKIMNQKNYQKELDEITSGINPEQKPLLLLHACCAPCSSYVLEYLSQYFRITVFFYNPNITSDEEYMRRVKELERFVKEAGYREDEVRILLGDYEPEVYYEAVRGMEHLPEKGERCYVCYQLRMEEAAKTAAQTGADYFTTTLSISPHKNAVWINEIGETLEKKYGVAHLPSDFKKKGGFQRSTVLSREYQLYRQDYCGCIFSKREAKKRRESQSDV